VGQRPFDEETRRLLEITYPDVAFDWPALLKTLQAALGGPRLPLSGPPPPPSRSRRPAPIAAAAAPARPPAGRPGPSYPSPAQPQPAPMAPAEIEPVEGEYIPGEVVLVTAEFEEREPSFAEPEFEPVCEADRQFAAAADFELVTDEIVHIPVPEPTHHATPKGGHVFAQSSEPAVFERDATADEDEPAATADSESEQQHEDATTSDAAAGSAGAAPPQRRRRRRGGRGRGKPADIR